MGGYYIMDGQLSLLKLLAKSCRNGSRKEHA